MRRKAFIIASAVLAAVPGAALAEGVYYLRNDTGRAFACGLRRERGSVIDRFQLRSGEDWSQTTPGEGVRILLCDVGAIGARYRMQAGMRYALVEEQGAVLLRAIGPAR